MVYGYIRVSTDKQTIKNRRFEIERFCFESGLCAEDWTEEAISGTKAPEKRQLGSLLNTVKKDGLIICSELSRLGRSLFMIMSIFSTCMKGAGWPKRHASKNGLRG
jgi:DNA invertase Pin-like site-specific DNA recombinase